MRTSTLAAKFDGMLCEFRRASGALKGLILVVPEMNVWYVRPGLLGHIGCNGQTS